MSVLTQDPAPVVPAAADADQTPAGRWPVGTGLDARRAVGLVAVLGLFAPAFTAWNDIVAVPSSGLAAVALMAGGLWLAGALALARTETELDRLERWLLVLALLVLAAWTATMLHTQSGYGTDEAALEQGAASLLLHGHDPYGANLLTSLAGFSTPAKYATRTLSGGLVSTFGYPALPLLVVAPFVELTGGGQAVPIANVAMLMLAMVALFKGLPAGWRSLAVVICAGFPILSGFALSGVNAIIAMALLLIAACRWTNTGAGGRLSRQDRWRALAFGLAVATNQIAWFMAPFLVAGIFLVRRAELDGPAARRVVARYLGWATAAFAVVNLPFVLWGPSAWLHGVAAPLTQHAIPYGQGIVDLTLFMRIGGGNLGAYDYCAALLYIALLILYVIRFRALGRACFLLPLIALFFSARSLGEYWMTQVAVIAVGALTADDMAIAAVAPLAFPGRRASGTVRRLAMAGLFLPAAVCLAVALGSPQPLLMRVLGAHANRTLRSVDRLRIAVQNRSGVAVQPHFSTNATGQAVFWTIASGPRTLAPGQGAVYVLRADNVEAMQPNGTSFLVQAVTSSPRTISSTSPYDHAGPVPGYW